MNPWSLGRGGRGLVGAAKMCNCVIYDMRQVENCPELEVEDSHYAAINAAGAVAFQRSLLDSRFPDTV